MHALRIVEQLVRIYSDGFSRVSTVEVRFQTLPLDTGEILEIGVEDSELPGFGRFFTKLLFAEDDGADVVIRVDVGVAPTTLP